jgi:hypothetical protein
MARKTSQWKHIGRIEMPGVADQALASLRVIQR